MLPYSSQICSAIDMIIKHISNEFLGSEFQTLKKAFQGSKQLWRWARTRSSHGGKAWRLAAANKNNKYVTSLRRKHFLCILFTQLSRLEHAPIPIWKLSPLSRVLLMYLLKIFSVPEPFYVHFFLKVKGYLLHFCGAKKTLLLIFRIYVQSWLCRYFYVICWLISMWNYQHWAGHIETESLWK